jgi:hypothetical protein
VYYCSSCGQAGDGRFCRICGGSLIAVPDQTPTGQAAMTTTPQPGPLAGEPDPQVFGGSGAGVSGQHHRAVDSAQSSPPTADPLLYGGGRRRHQGPAQPEAVPAGGSAEPLLYGGGTSRHAAGAGAGGGVLGGAVPVLDGGGLGAAEPAQAASPAPRRGPIMYGQTVEVSGSSGSDVISNAADSTRLLPPAAAGNPLPYGGSGSRAVPGTADSTQLLPPAAANSPLFYGAPSAGTVPGIADSTQLLPPTAAGNPLVLGASGTSVLPGPTDSTQLLPPTARNDPQMYGGAPKYPQAMPEPTRVLPPAAPSPPSYWAASPVAAPTPTPAPAPMNAPLPQPGGQAQLPSYQPYSQPQAWPQAAPPARPAGPSPFAAGPAGMGDQGGPGRQAGPGRPGGPAGYGGQFTAVQPPGPPTGHTQDWAHDPDSEGQPKIVLYGVLGAVAVAVAVIGGLLYFGTPSGPATTPAAASTRSQPPSATATPTSSTQLQLPPAPPTTAPPTTPPPAAPTGPITGYQGMCVDDRSGGTQNSNPVLIATCDSSADQTWSLASGDTLQAFGMCLDINGGATADATTVDLYTCNGTGAQTWEPQANGSLFNPQSNKCLDDTGFGGSGTQLQIWDCTGGPNQVWALP